jgi:hypothetical protein
VIVACTRTFSCQLAAKRTQMSLQNLAQFRAQSVSGDAVENPLNSRLFECLVAFPWLAC